MTTDVPDDFPIDDQELLRRARGTGPRRLFGQDRQEVARLAAWAGAQPAPDLRDAEAFLLFVGYPRSGHSLVGALLDAHPEIAIAHELDVLQLWSFGLDRRRILTLTLENARRLGRIGRNWGAYDYRVAGGAQGCWTRLRFVGDKRGGETTRRLSEDPLALDRFGEFLGLPLRFVHVVRHPADNVATMVRHARRRRDAGDEPMLLRKALSHYAALALANDAFLARTDPAQALTLWHEDLVADPRRELVRLADFLGIAAGDDYLDACAAIVQPTPNRSRDEVERAPEHRLVLRRIIARTPFLQRYAGEGGP